MDQSHNYFGKLEEYTARIRYEKYRKANKESIHQLEQEKATYLIKNIHRAIFKEGYSLIVDDIAERLDVDEKYVRLNILPHLEYITLPSGASDAFTAESGCPMNFLEMRIKKWKKIFIKDSSFEEFLGKNLRIYCPVVHIEWSEKQGQYIPRQYEMIERDYICGIAFKAIRKCNLAQVIREQKVNDLIRKTKNDITYAKKIGLIDTERLKVEMEILSSQKVALNIPVHNQEISKYIEKHLHYKMHLYKDIEMDIRPTVLYWFCE